MRYINTLWPRQDDRLFPDDIFKRIFLDENVRISIKISLKFVPKGQINNIPALVQIMVWRRPGDKPLSEPMMVSLLTNTCVTRPQWVNTYRQRQNGSHFAYHSFKCNFLNDNFWILNEMSLKCVPYGLIDNMATLAQIMAYHRSCDKPLSEPMMASFSYAYMRHSASTS